MGVAAHPATVRRTSEEFQELPRLTGVLEIVMVYRAGTVSYLPGQLVEPCVAYQDHGKDELLRYCMHACLYGPKSSSQPTP